MKYVITGGTGYIGTRLVEALSLRPDTEKIVVADIRAPRVPRAKTEFTKLDVRDRAGLRALLERHRPDALVHLAFILNPIRDEAMMYDVDVNGLLYALEAASAADVGQVLVTSSTTAYGAFADNPPLITEDWPVRGHPSFAYARHKAEADRLCQLWAATHPDKTMTIVRPCIVFGPSVDNYIVRAYNQAVFPAFRGLPDQQVQYVHEDDVAEAIALLLVGKHAGAFNVTGDGLMTWRQTAEVAERKIRELPFGLVKRLNALMWRLRVKGTESPPGNLDFIRHPWVCSNEKVKATLGWTPKHTSQETFEMTMRAKGVIGAEATNAPATSEPAKASSNGASAEQPAEVA